MQPSARDRFLDLLRTSVREGSLVKLTLGKYRGPDAALKNLFVRPAQLKAGPHLTCVWRYATRDVTRNFPLTEALPVLEPMIGAEFLHAHLFTPLHTVQLEMESDGSGRIATKAAASAPPAVHQTHDRIRQHPIASDAPWLVALGVCLPNGRPREGMAAKFRQIQKFTELIDHLVAEAEFPNDRTLGVTDMGSGKGYLTFAVADRLAARASVRGIEVRPELVDFCNKAARDHGFNQLSFVQGDIQSAPIEGIDLLIALHACDTATDDALARGIAAEARLLIVSPCCQKELRPQLTAPPVLADALKHGIFQERQSEFVTDSLRAQLLEWAGYRTKVFEFVSTEHTARNLMIAAIKSHPPGNPQLARRIQAFARFYGIRQQRLAEHLQFSLAEDTGDA